VEMDHKNPEKTALEGIARLEGFYLSCGLPVTLAGLGVPTDRLGEMADKATGKGRWTLGSFVKLDRNAVLDILTLAK